ncbi:phosphoribosylformylglycinamidine cyclo-ligase [Neoehrlichia mikurensis]|uniref:Phosphoribosylformylglycinamidine cyclo-ligase n=1 Tax=Neoehrlichia mikurensis TaxID=89586 RepID=A0A9Q9F3S2_9RICK|nr:phosphoribosylformylglycinamidine cyclo-ligase [Neoehrlichia mikurensis]QXK91747.1 phosphoribosylformylglycinamidine cyclo-ligase [Neoehrlichia mikurensis]QXK92959.1 phosphoribosylformylglycinamidine cyclo-ligase [Neoehrlichia mikurensis]QXK93437.1 phosphoribosylformylglycinamidine cyclo-ligase [Neoehrlichia mikurensis]UTO55609.1 phosphoribosylformylglycinamidine cyclo-ligase [Neoehrlichia mikurensis]UTO56530.1 phosphoribosylformylglycinamidine cyclo-ligase [Neoehrlichia mikurensis]
MSTYQDSGVNIKNANKLVKNIQAIAKSTARVEVIGDIGGFGGLFDLSIIKKYNNPVLVSSTDGVGTKLCIAQEVNNHQSIGIDLVAMCINDILCHGAEPLFFLDYFATGKLDNNIALQIINGIVQGCKKSNVTLIGGETAEMPGMYSDTKYDLAGFAVGIVEKEKILPIKNSINPDDVILGLPSSGIHSNGFSLIRKILQDFNISYNDKCPWHNSSWADVLLTPTYIYTKYILPIFHLVKGISHITGGGFIENIPRILPENLAANIFLDSWKKPPIFNWIEKIGNISQREMLNTFNYGIGMVIIASKKNAETLKNIFSNQGNPIYIIGNVTYHKSSEKVIFK